MRARLGLFVGVALLTVILAPVAFGVLLYAGIAVYQAANAVFDFVGHPVTPLGSPFPIVFMIAWFGGSLAAAPTMLLGVPVAMLLERLRLTRRIHYVLGGIAGGLIGAHLLLIATDSIWGFYAGREWRIVALGAIHGPIAAMIFHSLVRAATPPA